jgi:hypothetical protein
MSAYPQTLAVLSGKPPWVTADLLALPPGAAVQRSSLEQESSPSQRYFAANDSLGMLDVDGDFTGSM